MDGEGLAMFDDLKRGDIGGWLIGVGGYTPRPIPRTDADGRPIGFWHADEVVQRDVQTAGHATVATHEHLSEVREPYLRNLAREVGFEYLHMNSLDSIREAMLHPRFAEQRRAPTDFAWLAAVAALVHWLRGFARRACRTLSYRIRDDSGSDRAARTRPEEPFPMRLSVRELRRAVVAIYSSLFVSITVAATTVAATSAQHSPAAGTVGPRRNLIIFIADGLRHDSVNATDAPTLLALRQRGVHFVNSHSLFPTLTTPNASAIATGHYLGDTGDFSNAEYVGFPTFNHGDFGKAPGSPTPFLENDPVLGDLGDHAPNGNFLNETSLLALARQHGFNTAAIGKLGPAALQDITQLKPTQGHFTAPATVILDDSTGSAAEYRLFPKC